jgi:hypothetical protein
MIDEEDSAEVGDETNASEDVQVPVVKATRPQGRSVQFCFKLGVGCLKLILYVLFVFFTEKQI